MLWMGYYRSSPSIIEESKPTKPNELISFVKAKQKMFETNIDVPNIAADSYNQQIKLKLNPELIKAFKNGPLNGIGGQIAPPLNSDLEHSNKKASTKSNNEFPKVKPIKGWGELGKPVILNDEESILSDETFKDAAFSVYISDRIPYNRTIPETRHIDCHNNKYDSPLPSTSVVIIFYNEIFSALMRTIYSVINRTPAKLLREIVLVDDNSDRKELKMGLVTYIQNNFPPGKVKLIRLSEREGLIRARLAGAKTAVGDVLVFLDSHCEVNAAWLEPMLQEIKNNPKAVVCPIIDIIDDKTLQYEPSSGDYFQIGGFTWSGYFNWIDLPDNEQMRRKSIVDPARSPTMAGGLFAINRKYFFDVGSYDSAMDTWGGENLEMSFRIWMCGGELLIVPCSHVGHIFRSFHPYPFPKNKDSHGINTVRTVEVWMDEYKKYFYLHRPDLRSIEFGDISERVNLRKKLQCQSFDWYLKNVFPSKFIWDQNVKQFGSVRNPYTDLCIDILDKDEAVSHPLGVDVCKGNGFSLSKNQLFAFSNIGELRREDNCAKVSYVITGVRLKVVMDRCDGTSKSQRWSHIKGGPLVHLSSGKCLDARGVDAGTGIFVSPCHGGHSQIWWFSNYLDIQIDVDDERM